MLKTLQVRSMTSKLNSLGIWETPGKGEDLDIFAWEKPAVCPVLAKISPVFSLFVEKQLLP